MRRTLCCLLLLSAAYGASLVTCLYDVQSLAPDGGGDAFVGDANSDRGPSGFCSLPANADADFCCDFDENLDAGWQGGPFGTGDAAWNWSYGDGGVLGLSLDAFVSPPASGFSFVPDDADASNGAQFGAYLSSNNRSHLRVEWEMNVSVVSPDAGKQMIYFSLGLNGIPGWVLYLGASGRGWFFGDTSTEYVLMLPTSLQSGVWIHLVLDLVIDAWPTAGQATLTRINDVNGVPEPLLFPQRVTLMDPDASADASFSAVQVGFGAANFQLNTPAAVGLIDNVVIRWLP